MKRVKFALLRVRLQVGRKRSSGKRVFPSAVSILENKGAISCRKIEHDFSLCCCTGDYVAREGILLG
jgi:hypothetical protein